MIDLMLRSAASRSTRSIIGTGSRKPLLQRRAGLDEIAARVELFAYEMLRYLAVAGLGQQIGRASVRDRVCQYVSVSVVAVALKKTMRWTVVSATGYQSIDSLCCGQGS